MKMYYDIMQQEENTALHFPSIKTGVAYRILLLPSQMIRFSGSGSYTLWRI
jgi:hypothetical protein